jgi:hypothetical protein
VPGEALGEKADTIHCDVGCGLASDSARNLALRFIERLTAMTAPQLIYLKKWS